MTRYIGFDAGRSDDVTVENYNHPPSQFDLEHGDGEDSPHDTPTHRRFILDYFASGDLWGSAKNIGMTATEVRTLVATEWFKVQMTSLRQNHASKHDREVDLLRERVIAKLSDRIQYGDEVVLVVDGTIQKVRKDVPASQLVTILDRLTKHRVMFNNPMNGISRNNPDADAVPLEHAAHPGNPAHMADPQKQMEMQRKLQEERMKRMDEMLGGGHQTIDAEFTEVRVVDESIPTESDEAI